MDAIRNPYSPGAGLRPPLLAGRQQEVDAFDAVLRRGELGRVSQGLMLTGLRGVGKTVLLNELAARAAASRWITVQLEVRPGGALDAFSSLASSLTIAIREQQGPKLSEIARRALGSIKGFSVTVDPNGPLSVSLDVEAVRSGHLETDFAALAKHLLNFGITLEAVAEEYRPNFLCNYLFELAGKFTGFYENCPVLKAEGAVRESRLALCDLTARVLKQGLDVLGIETVEQM